MKDYLFSRGIISKKKTKKNIMEYVDEAEQSEPIQQPQVKIKKIQDFK